MKKILLLQVYLIIINAVIAQDFPDFATPSKDDLDLTECPFDKDAAAVVLMHEGFSYSKDDYKLITTQHIRIKILKQSGNKVANISIPFIRINDFEKIKDLEAVTINTEENGVIKKYKVDKKSIYTNKINKVFGEINFAFPSVKAGSIIEYQFKSIKQSYFGLEDWYFQREIPVLVSRYHLKMSNSKQFNYRMIQGVEPEITILPGKDNIFVEMRKVPAFSKEPFMDSEKDYRQRINFKVDGYDSRWGNGQTGTLSSSWGILNARLLFSSYFGSQILSTIRKAVNFTDSAKKITDEYERMQHIYKFVRNRITWNKNNSIYADDLNGVWEKQTADNGDINMLLINLLNETQLDVYPLLISKRDNGRVDTNYAYSEQFNTLLACVIINGKKYMLDATDKYNDEAIPPIFCLNTTGFLIDPKKGELINIKSDSSGYNERIDLLMEINDNDILKGNAVINNKAYARLEKLILAKSDFSNLKDRYIEQTKIPVSINNYNTTYDTSNTANSDFIEKIDFSAPLAGSGKYNFIPLNLFSSFTQNPFVSEKRYSDINLGYNQSLIIKTKVKLSGKYSVDALPENTELNFQEAGMFFSRTGKVNNAENSFEFEIQIVRNKSYFSNTEYEAIMTAYKAIVNKFAEQVVLKIK